MDKDLLIKLGIQKRNGEIKDSWNDIGVKFGITGEQARDVVRKYIKRNNLNNNENKDVDISNTYKTTVEINKDGSQTSDRLLQISEEQCKDVKFLLECHGYSPTLFELVSARNNIWNIQSKVEGVKTLYSSKITVRPRVDNISFDEIKEHFNELSNNYQSPIHIPTRYDIDGKMLELNISDLHLGKLSWIGDAGESYDYKIARDRFFYIINDVLTRTSHYKFNKILFIWSQDFFHYDSTTG